MIIFSHWQLLNSILFIGAYDDEEAAARAYDLAALKYWGPGTLINFPVRQSMPFFIFVFQFPFASIFSSSICLFICFFFTYWCVYLFVSFLLTDDTAEPVDSILHLGFCLCKQLGLRTLTACFRLQITQGILKKCRMFQERNTLHLFVGVYCAYFLAFKLKLCCNLC